ncbi:unnamed protein product, partial [Discosporangium mesarthrocarpum]
MYFDEPCLLECLPHSRSVHGFGVFVSCILQVFVEAVFFVHGDVKEGDYLTVSIHISNLLVGVPWGCFLTIPRTPTTFSGRTLKHRKRFCGRSFMVSKRHCWSRQATG